MGVYPLRFYINKQWNNQRMGQMHTDRPVAIDPQKNSRHPKKSSAGRSAAKGDTLHIYIIRFFSDAGQIFLVIYRQNPPYIFRNSTNNGKITIFRILPDITDMKISG